MSKYWWIPIKIIKIKNGALLIYKMNYKIFNGYKINWWYFRPLLRIIRRPLYVSFEIGNMVFRLQEYINLNNMCEICLGDPADCYEDVMEEKQNSEYYQCYKDNVGF